MPASLLCDFADIISSPSPTEVGTTLTSNSSMMFNSINGNNSFGNFFNQQQSQRQTFNDNDFIQEFNQLLQLSSDQSSNDMNMLRNSSSSTPTVNSLLNALNTFDFTDAQQQSLMLKKTTSASPSAAASPTIASALLNQISMTTKRSQNTTECVPVPSSEHVAEIVGRQGCKIKALRAKTNTYIKTPVRGEEPVFVVTGRKEDVNAAKREILSAAEHFSQIRAQRKNNPGNVGPAPNAHLPGHITIQVRVPYRVVGLVVGPKGATIKRIQQQTNTYIITPSREKDPVFEVTGLPDDVETARKEVEAHIAIRTGGIIDSSAATPPTSTSLASITAGTLPSTTTSISTPDENIVGSGNSPTLPSFDNLFTSCYLNNQSNNNNTKTASMAKLINPQLSSATSASNSTSSSLKSQTFKELCSIFQINDHNHSSSLSASPPNSLLSSFRQTTTINSNGSSSYDIDEGLGGSPTSFDNLFTTSNLSTNQSSISSSSSSASATFQSLWPSSNESSTASTRNGSFQMIDEYIKFNSNNNNDNIEKSLMMMTNLDRRSSLESNIPNTSNNLGSSII